MTAPTPLSRERVIRILDGFDIRGADVYLLELVPLIEMIWADGEAQASEQQLLAKYSAHLVERTNRVANHPVLTLEAAKDFTRRFLVERPSPRLMSALRQLADQVAFEVDTEEEAIASRHMLLSYCLDIAASAVVGYPYGMHERFDAREKATFFEIMRTLSPRDA